MAANENAETREMHLPEAGARPAVSVRVDFGARSDAGRVRPNNEDHFAILRMGRSLDLLATNLPEQGWPRRTEEVGYVIAVADGMGGKAAGEQASMLALRSGLGLVLDNSTWFLKIQDEAQARELADQMRDYVRRIDESLILRSKADPELAGMGTTLTVSYSIGAEAFLVHAGDSRAYLLRDGGLHQLTHDHTLAQSFADAGLIDAEQVATHSRRHVLTNYVGGPPFGIDPEVDSLRLADGDRLLLCTDGLTGMVSDREIAETLRRHDDPSAACDALIDLALERGGRDNVTVVLARYAIFEPSPAEIP